MNFNNQTYIVGVRLNNGKDELTSKVYHFLAPAPLAVGDTVVCDTCNGFIVGMVAEIDVKESSVHPLKEVVDRVDVEPWRERRRAEARRKELKQKMDERVAQLQEEAVYAMLAEKDPVLAKMLDEYGTLNF